MQGTMPGARRQGRPRTAWMDIIIIPAHLGSPGKGPLNRSLLFLYSIFRTEQFVEITVIHYCSVCRSGAFHAYCKCHNG